MQPIKSILPLCFSLWATPFFISSLDAKPVSHASVSIAAIVGEKGVITTKDIDDRMALIGASGSMDTRSKEARRKLYPQVLQALISEHIQREVAEQFKIPLEANEIEESLEELANGNGQSLTQLKSFLASRHIPLSTLRSRIQSQLLWGKYIRALCDYKKINVTKADILDYKNKQVKYKNQLQLHLSEIVIPFSGAKGQEQAKARAYDIISQLKKGAPFAHLAQNFSQSLSRTQGGDIGWFAHEQMDHCMQTNLTTLISGQISAPIRYSNKYVIYRVNQRIEKGQTAQRLNKIDVRYVLIPIPPKPTEADIKPYAADIDLLANVKSTKDFVSRAKTLKYTLHEHKGLDTTSLDPLWNYYYTQIGLQKVGPPNMTHEGLLIGYIERKYGMDEKPMSDEQIKRLLEQKKLSTYASREMQKLFDTIRVDIYKKNYA
jgi:peptidyl-prolyl cis-trans isomerase SurA